MKQEEERLMKREYKRVGEKNMGFGRDQRKNVLYTEHFGIYRGRKNVLA